MEPVLTTVIAHWPDFVLSYVDVAVMVALPLATAVTKPLLLTVATAVLLEDQVTPCDGLLVPLTVDHLL